MTDHVSDLALNNPLTRQQILTGRLKDDNPLIATELAAEFGVSLDTIRRDLLCLEEEGLIQRVRGGAVPVNPPAAPFAQRVTHGTSDPQKLVAAALPLIRQGMTLIIDGGTTMAALARVIPALKDLLVITPSPAIASIALEKGIATHLVGGRLSPLGGIAVGGASEAAMSNMAGDLAFLGICGLDADFGLSADDADEASLRRIMAAAARRTILLCDEGKIGQRARHKVLPPDHIQMLISNATPDRLAPFSSQGIDILPV